MAPGSRKETRLISLARLILGGLFVASGLLKALDPAQFLIAVESFRLLPYVPAVVAAFTLPYLEIVCGGALLLRRGYAGALWLLLALVSLFVCAIASAWIRRLDFTCGCFGSSLPTNDYIGYLLRDLALMGLIAFLLGLDR